MFLCVGGESEPTGLKSFSADQPSANTGKGKMEPVAAMSTGNNLSKNGGDVFETGEGKIFAQHENCLFFTLNYIRIVCCSDHVTTYLCMTN